MLKDQISKHFPRDIIFPAELSALCDWEEENGYPISGCFELRADEHNFVESWFGTPAPSKSLAMFGAGAEGSLYCIWDIGNGEDFPIVHLGSEGDEVKVLSSDFSDFLVLLSIGYNELGFEDLTNEPRNDEGINIVFQRWVQNSLQRDIPKSGWIIVNQARSCNEHFLKWMAQFDD